MKQMIVMISMILLGIAISGIVLSFNDTAKQVASNSKTTILEQIASQSAIL